MKIIFLFIVLVLTRNCFAESLVIYSDLPTNTVLSFDLPSCPEGWSQFQQASGRFILGSGSGNTDMDANALTNRIFGDTGGHEKTTAIPVSSTVSGQFTTPAPNKVVSLDGFDNTFNDASFTDTSLGGELNDSNMPPFLSLIYCVKD